MAMYCRTDPDHPLTVAAIGSLGGLVSVVLTWLAERMQLLDSALALLTHIVGLGVAILTFMLLLRRWLRGRQLPPPREPADVDDNLPL